MTVFIFNLDGIITKKEILPLIEKHFCTPKEIKKLTKETISGNIPFVEGFIRQMNGLSKLPVDEISNLIENIPLFYKVTKFISKNKNNCILVSNNLSCWIEKLTKKIGCICYSSSAEVENNHVTKIIQIIKKENIVRQYKDLGEKVVFIGNENNDMEAMKIADFSITCSLTHKPIMSLLTLTDYLVFKEEALCRQLSQLL